MTQLLHRINYYRNCIEVAEREKVKSQIVGDKNSEFDGERLNLGSSIINFDRIIFVQNGVKMTITPRSAVRHPCHNFHSLFYRSINHMNIPLFIFQIFFIIILIGFPNPTNGAPTTAKYNYGEVLHKSFLFYHAQRSGNLTGHRKLAWRTDSCFQCKGLNGEDLSGGYYEAGIYIF